MREHFTKIHLRHEGFTLVEIVVATAMLTIFFLSISSYYKKVLDVSQDTTRHIQSSFLLEEGLEAMRTLRDQSWSTYVGPLSTSTTYYLYWNGTQWRPTTTVQTVENLFTRSFRVSQVYRDGSDNISSSGTLDPGTKKVIVDVVWLRKGGKLTATDTAETYITDLLSN